jgi:hypothetical protein
LRIKHAACFPFRKFPPAFFPDMHGQPSDHTDFNYSLHIIS